LSGKLSTRTVRRENGVTALDTVILLIAFTVVATVFAFTATTAGMFSSNKSQRTVDRGLAEIGSTLELRGGVLAYTANQTIGVGKVEFTVINALQTGSPVDLTPPYFLSGGAPVESGLPYTAIVSFSDNNTAIDDCVWTLDWAGSHSDDYSLEGKEKAIITVWLHRYDGAAWTDDATSPPYLGSGNYVAAGHSITLELKTSPGATLIMERTMPSYLRNVMDLH